ncbi:MAG: hypothetical protein J6J37_04565 [Bacteroidaceae bacterium]|nr:hypothetical protein [Bacteroidaceae bacterium]
MKKNILIAVVVFVLSACSNGDGSIRRAIEEMRERYLSTTLQDIYKSCFQDYYGVTHLLSDRESVKRYIDYELSNADSLVSSYYEPCGWRGEFIRVNLSAIRDERITTDMLTDAFMASAEFSMKNSTEEWKTLWQDIMAEARKTTPVLKNFSEDSIAIAALLDRGEYVMHHSKEYRDAHHPHYRIIHHTIFERDILPHLQE